jgi:hypothetical protein
MNGERRGLLTRGAAETLATDAFAWLAGEPDALARFMHNAGIEASALRLAAGDRGFLSGVLDFVTGDDALLVAFAAQAGVRPERIVAARRTLNGYD